MARLLGPDPSSRLVSQIVSYGTVGFSGRAGTVYTDEAATTLAVISVYDGTGTPGATISGSIVTLGADSRIPRFWFPDTVDTLYVKVVGMEAVWQITADVDSRLEFASGSGNLILGATKYLSGGGLRVSEAANSKQGVATLASGAAVVSNTSITTSSRIVLTVQSLGTVAAPKAVGVTARSAGVSFTITSADATDTSVVAYQIFEPA